MFAINRYTPNDSRYGCQTDDYGVVIDPFTQEEIPNDCEVVSYYLGNKKYCFNLTTLFRYWKLSKNCLNPITRTPLPTEIMDRLSEYEKEQVRVLNINDVNVYINTHTRVFEVILKVLKMKDYVVNALLKYDVEVDGVSLYEEDLEQFYSNIYNNKKMYGTIQSLEPLEFSKKSQTYLLKVFTYAKDRIGDEGLFDTIYSVVGTALNIEMTVNTQQIGINLNISTNDRIIDMLQKIYSAFGSNSIEKYIITTAEGEPIWARGLEELASTRDQLILEEVYFLERLEHDIGGADLENFKDTLMFYDYENYNQNQNMFSVFWSDRVTPIVAVETMNDIDLVKVIENKLYTVEELTQAILRYIEIERGDNTLTYFIVRSYPFEVLNDSCSYGYILEKYRSLLLSTAQKSVFTELCQYMSEEKLRIFKLTIRSLSLKELNTFNLGQVKNLVTVLLDLDNMTDVLDLINGTISYDLFCSTSAKIPYLDNSELLEIYLDKEWLNLDMVKSIVQASQKKTKRITSYYINSFKVNSNVFEWFVNTSRYTLREKGLTLFNYSDLGVITKNLDIVGSEEFNLFFIETFTQDLSNYPNIKSLLKFMIKSSHLTEKTLNSLNVNLTYSFNNRYVVDLIVRDKRFKRHYEVLFQVIEHISKFTNSSIECNENIDKKTIIYILKNISINDYYKACLDCIRERNSKDLSLILSCTTESTIKRLSDSSGTILFFIMDSTHYDYENFSKFLFTVNPNTEVAEQLYLKDRAYGEQLVSYLSESFLIESIDSDIRIDKIDFGFIYAACKKLSNYSIKRIAESIHLDSNNIRCFMLYPPQCDIFQIHFHMRAIEWAVKEFNEALSIGCKGKDLYQIYGVLDKNVILKLIKDYSGVINLEEIKEGLKYTSVFTDQTKKSPRD